MSKHSRGNSLCFFLTAHTGTGTVSSGRTHVGAGAWCGEASENGQRVDGQKDSHKRLSVQAAETFLIIVDSSMESSFVHQ